MLQRTFCHVDGIGYQTERRLWEQGADCWETFLADPTSFRLPRQRLATVLDTLTGSRTALARQEYRYFQQRLPSREHWRALRSFEDRVAYLDIETDGGTDFDSVTVIGLYDGRNVRHFVRGENLLDFEEALDGIAVLVTYYGAGFDIPVLRRAFPRLPFDQLHVDLCPTLRRLGLQGGLKSVERQLGIERSAETTGLDGLDAVRLWREWRSGDADALQRLLAYNAEDIVNLAPLARFAYTQLGERLSSMMRGEPAGSI